MLKFRSPTCAALVCASVALAPLAAKAAQTVPFVGCPSDGQQGPVAAPKGQPKAVNVEPAAAARLAWYQARYTGGALAPRGWKCFSLYGSSGTTLTIVATNGPANGQFVMLESTNVALPLGQWTRVLTNSFNASGDLNLSTNIVSPNNPREFYILQVP